MTLATAHHSEAEPGVIPLHCKPWSTGCLPSLCRVPVHLAKRTDMTAHGVDFRLVHARQSSGEDTLWADGVMSVYAEITHKFTFWAEFSSGRLKDLGYEAGRETPASVVASARPE